MSHMKKKKQEIEKSNKENSVKTFMKEQNKIFNNFKLKINRI